ncbi:chitinase [Nocardiopsis mangrovi]|uniref:Chitinase n=1 Tax=Nocardiopsis mangrovi TaxID=1179818 RepID=A0ABV9E6J1_9ACTN
MRSRTLTALTAAALLPLGLWAAPGAASAEAEEPAPIVANDSAADPSAMGAAPYLYYGWGNPPDAAQLMQQTGVQWFTLAFILSDGGCSPAWDGTRPLDGADADRIAAIRAAGGDVIPSIGGWSGNKLGEACSDSESLAAAYQQVVDAYDLAAIDIDIESTEIENEATQDRVLGAVRILKDANPDLHVAMTLGTAVEGPNSWGERLITRAAETDAGVDNWTIMPFNFGGGSDMAGATQQASEGLNEVISSAYGISSAEAYAMQGISSMNGITDQGETVTAAAYTQMRDFAQANGMSRFTFWSVNRDRPCATPTDSCGGIDQQEWEFTSITAGFAG